MKNDYKHIYDLCKEHMHAYVLAEMADGSKIDGIVTGLDDEYVYFAVPLEQNQISQDYPSPEYQRLFGYPGYGYGFGYPGYGYPPPRFRRLILPLAALTALSVLPWY